MDSHHIKTKIGIHEFEANGPKDLVTEQYKAWLAAISSMQATLQAAPAAPAGATPRVDPPPPPRTFTGVPRDVLDRVFREDDGLSLAALPTTDNAAPDALVALLYGFWKIRGEVSVTGTALMKAARKSGVNVDRIDRVIGVYIPTFVQAGGVKKARRYQLNNPGNTKAEEIINAILK